MSFALFFSPALPAQTPALEHFETKIRPVLASRCYACHGAASAKPQAGLRLDTSEGIRQGGNSGPLVDATTPERSVLLRALSHQDKELKMPPGKPLPPEMVAEFERWVRSGAPVPEDRQASKLATSGQKFWSLERPKRQPLPNVQQPRWARNDIDRFVLAKLEEKGLQPSPEADKRALLRRVTYDLLGLPPEPGEMEAFLADNSADAYEKQVDRLLASPHYGERWARHWLDVARYSDARDPGDRYPWSYTYRDWVIRAFNEDLPYDHFLVQQLAADRVENNDRRNLAALGYISLGREYIKIFPETVDDRIDAVTRGMLGLTVACARCHDHKYDPIPTKDYYSLYSVFSNIREPEALPVIGQPAAAASKQRMYEDRLARIREADAKYRQRRHAEMIAFFKTQVAEYLLAAKDASTLTNTGVEELVRDRQLNLYLLNRWRDFLKVSNGDKDPVVREWHASLERGELGAKGLRDLAEKYAAMLAARDRLQPLDVPLSDFELIYTEGDGNNTRSLRNQYTSALAMYAYDGGAPRAMAIEDVPHPKPAHVFLRGNANNPGVETPARFLTCLSDGEPQRFTSGSGRLELARAIASKDNPLTARVMVNRVWMHHFGQALVRTPSDFGLRGEAPSHPELLDHLAVTFMDEGWSLKKLHRAILLSSTYRQSSADRAEARKVDPENILLWRMNRRRLDFESLRDSMLVASGSLDSRIGGTPFSLTALPSVPRRTVYGYVERGRIPGMLSLFDFPTPDQHAPMRYTTTVPQQALFLLNSAFVTGQAKALLLRRELAEVSEAEQRIRQLYRFLFARGPKPDELSAGLRFVRENVAASPDSSPEPVWLYGTRTGKQGFEPFRYFTGDSWQGASMLPDPIAGSARLRANGGEPGSTGVVRRWVSPIDGTVTVEGNLRHNQRTPKIGDGVHGRFVSSRLGELASWVVDGRTADTRMTGIEVKKGDTLDFVVEGRQDPEADDFSWSPIIASADAKGPSWKASADFRGPSPERLNTWEQYAQVLLQTNEFAFVD